MKLIKEKKGFTLVELVVVIAILGILAGIAIPRFMEATKSARGAKIVADMRTIESAVNVYYVKYGAYPATDAADGFADIVNGGTWPSPPVGDFVIARTNGDATPTEGNCTASSAYAYAKNADDVDDSGAVTLTTATFTSTDVGTAPTVTQLLNGGVAAQNDNDNG